MWYGEGYGDPERFVTSGAGLLDAALRSFDLSSEALLVEELGTHLKRNFSDVFSLDWLKFESLAEDLYCRNGLQVARTARGADGGVDLLVIGDGNEIVGLVQCKKNARDRTVGVSVVRELVGAARDPKWGGEVGRVILVTSAKISRPAYDYGERIRTTGLSVDLVDGGELLSLLDVYNETLPPMNLLTDELLNELASSNRELLAPKS